MILDIAQGVAAALAHLHAKNVVHGDLNPKNVLLKHVAQPAPGMGLGPSWGGRAGSGGRPAGSGAAMQANKLHQAALMASLMPPANSAQYGAYPYAGRCGYAIKVADFGLSVKMENSHISGLRQGTPFYAAPVSRCVGACVWLALGCLQPPATWHLAARNVKHNAVSGTPKGWPMAGAPGEVWFALCYPACVALS